MQYQQKMLLGDYKDKKVPDSIMFLSIFVL